MSYKHNRFPSPKEVAHCAYLIWEQEGRPAGREKEHWHQAEIQLMACRAHDHWTDNPAPVTPPPPICRSPML